ncbi:Hypothetical protein (Fragment) [Durusdinium trenchii]|uniref:J domain-containing protein n=1 Tax=Durusdinium trenchii TaxID=1381693 RepID=A0ABP0I0Y3_9DINO
MDVHHVMRLADDILHDPLRSKLKGLFTGVSETTFLPRSGERHVCAGDIVQSGDSWLDIAALQFIPGTGFACCHDADHIIKVHLESPAKRSIRLSVGVQVLCAGVLTRQCPGKEIWLEDATISFRPEFVKEMEWTTLHLYAGAFSGWSQAMHWLHDTQEFVLNGQEIFIDVDDMVMQVWSLKNHAAVLSTPIAFDVAWAFGQELLIPQSCCQRYVIEISPTLPFEPEDQVAACLEDGPEWLSFVNSDFFRVVQAVIETLQDDNTTRRTSITIIQQASNQWTSVKCSGCDAQHCIEKCSAIQDYHTSVLAHGRGTIIALLQHEQLANRMPLIVVDIDQDPPLATIIQVKQSATVDCPVWVDEEEKFIQSVNGQSTSQRAALHAGDFISLIDIPQERVTLHYTAENYQPHLCGWNLMMRWYSWGGHHLQIDDISAQFQPDAQVYAALEMAMQCSIEDWRQENITPALGSFAHRLRKRFLLTLARFDHQGRPINICALNVTHPSDHAAAASQSQPIAVIDPVQQRRQRIEAEQSPHNDRADAADAADTKAVSAQSTWTKPQAPHAEPQVPEVGFQKFMDASRRRTLSRSNADAKNADGGCLTRTWIEMAEARRTLGQAEQSDSDSRPGVSHGLCTPEKVAWEAMKRALESSPSPRKCRKMDRESVGSSRSTTDTEASSSVEKPNSRARAEPHPEPSPARQAASCPQDGHVKQMSETVKELKALLRQHSIDFSHCVEKSELQELWRSFSSLQRPSDRARPRLSPSAQPASQQVQEQPRVPARTEAESSRDREAQEEVLRILPLRREAFPSATLWAFAVLGASHDSGSVQRSYRSLMRKLHPDKVKITEGVEKTTALIREAKDLCERSLSNLVVPGPPQSLRYEVLGYEMGRRRYRLCWQPPERNMAAPVSRYLVAALDPAYGKALTITVLEPDYNEELKRFVSVEELNSFVLAEEDLQKMPSLWKQPTAMVQVCAANDAGQSSWSKLEIYIAGAKPSVVRIPSSPGTDSEASSSLASSPGKHFSQDSFNREIQRLTWQHGFESSICRPRAIRRSSLNGSWM